MRTLIQWIILIGLALFALKYIVSCEIEQEAAQAKIPPVKRYDVKLLFEVDGCKVYSFQDGSSYNYFTNCNGSVSQQRIIQNGKTTTAKYETID